jgi:hypothetical protein
MLRFLPCASGALVAYLAVTLTGWVLEWWLEALLYAGVFVVVTGLTDRALRDYGRSR